MFPRTVVFFCLALQKVLLFIYFFFPKWASILSNILPHWSKKNELSFCNIACTGARWVQPIGIRCQVWGIFKLMSSSWLLEPGWPHRCAWNGFRRQHSKCSCGVLETVMAGGKSCCGTTPIYRGGKAWPAHPAHLPALMSNCPSDVYHLPKGLFFQNNTPPIWLITATVLIFFGFQALHPPTDSEPGMQYLPYVFFPVDIALDTPAGLYNCS